MKLRHAAALALVGWYLLFPPFSQWLDYQGVSGYHKAELRNWQRLETFDTRQDCERAEDQLRERYDKDQKEPVLNRTQYNLRLAQCVQTGDPRLKEK
jgi:hypothetical protein